MESLQKLINERQELIDAMQHLSGEEALFTLRHIHRVNKEIEAIDPKFFHPPKFVPFTSDPPRAAPLERERGLIHSFLSALTGRLKPAASRGQPEKPLEGEI